MHLVLKGRFGRKQSVQILIGYGGAADSLCWGCHAVGSRARLACLVADPGERVSSQCMSAPTRWVQTQMTGSK